MDRKIPDFTPKTVFCFAGREKFSRDSGPVPRSEAIFPSVSLTELGLIPHNVTMIFLVPWIGPTMPEQPEPRPVTQPFPSGEAHPSYGYAVTLWLVLFLGVLCLGMLNYLGIYLKRL